MSLKNKLLKENLHIRNKIGGGSDMEMSVPIDLAIDRMVRNVRAKVSNLGTKLGTTTTFTRGHMKEPICMKSALEEALKKDGGSKGWRLFGLSFLVQVCFSFYEVRYYYLELSRGNKLEFSQDIKRVFT